MNAWKAAVQKAKSIETDPRNRRIAFILATPYINASDLLYLRTYANLCLGKTDLSDLEAANRTIQLLYDSDGTLITLSLAIAAELKTKHYYSFINGQSVQAWSQMTRNSSHALAQHFIKSMQREFVYQIDLLNAIVDHIPHPILTPEDSREPFGDFTHTELRTMRTEVVEFNMQHLIKRRAEGGNYPNDEQLKSLMTRENYSPAAKQFIELFYIGMPYYYSSLVEAQAKLDSSHLFNALIQHKKTQGAYPESLDELVPSTLASLPTQPLSGAPYVYQKPSTPDSPGLSATIELSESDPIKVSFPQP